MENMTLTSVVENTFDDLSDFEGFAVHEATLRAIFADVLAAIAREIPTQTEKEEQALIGIVAPEVLSFAGTIGGFLDSLAEYRGENVAYRGETEPSAPDAA